MVYEARWSRRFHIVMAVAVALLSVLGFVAAGVIPSESTRVGGSYPVVGWAIVAACFGAAFIFVRRALNREPQARADRDGVWTPRLGAPVPWSEIDRFYVMHAGFQRIARFSRRGGREFGINTTFYDRGIAELVVAVRHHLPDSPA
jgi:hypothetical protein